MVTTGGFTILELLVVIIIIALLFSLIMPALTRVRSMSVKMVCGSYMMQYGSVARLYLNDNDGLFPKPDEWLYRKGLDSREHPIGCRWHDEITAPDGEFMSEHPEYRGTMWDYIGGMGIGPCPTFRRFAESRGCENPNHNPKLDIKPQNSYSINGYLGSERQGGVLRESQVREPEKVFFFAEENNWSLRPDHPKYPATWLSAPLSTRALDDTVLMISPTPEARDCFGTYHNAPGGDLNRGYGNVLFVDGHVEPIDAEQQLRNIMHGSLNRGNPAGNLSWAWASDSEPPRGWEGQ